ncbi:MAG: Large exoprotein [Pseudoclavibacter caeni]|jgi:hypothetical protein
MSGLLGQIGGALLVLCIVGLWLAVLVPGWIERRNARTAARDAMRVQRAANVLARGQELPKEYDEEVSARRAAVLAREARRMERERERAERIAAQARTEQERERLRRAVPAVVVAARRGRRLGGGLVLVGLALLITGGIVAAGHGWGLSLIILGALGLLGGAFVRRRATVTLRRHLRADARADARPADAAPVYDVDADLPQDDDGQRAAGGEAWTPHPLPKPLNVTRAEALRAALAEAERLGVDADADAMPGLRPARPDDRPARAPETPAAQVDAEIHASLGEDEEYAWLDGRAGVDTGFDADRLDDILKRRRNVG